MDNSGQIQKKPSRAEKALRRLSRRLEVAELVFRGVKQFDIADKLGVSRQTVCEDMAQLKLDFRNAAAMRIDEAKGRELHRLAVIEKEAWGAWERSKQQRTSEKTSQEENDNGIKTKAEVRREDQYGDPRYMELIERCIDKRCRILGLYAPQRVAHSGDPDGAPIRVESKKKLDWSKLTLQEVDQIRQVRQKILERSGLVKPAEESPALDGITHIIEQAGAPSLLPPGSANGTNGTSEHHGPADASA